MDLFPGGRLKRAEVTQRRSQVVELVSAGWDYDQIAAELGQANRSGAWKAHQRALATQRARTVEEHLALEVARLDAMQDALWDKVMTGHVRSIREIRQFIMQRSRLLQLDSGKPGRRPEGPTSVVLPSYWQHMSAHHPQDWRVCRCPEIAGENVNEDEFTWPGEFRTSRHFPQPPDERRCFHVEVIGGEVTCIRDSIPPSLQVRCAHRLRESRSAARGRHGLVMW